MSELQVIQDTLKRTGRRRRLERGWRGFWQGLLCGGCLWLLTLALYKLLPIPALSLLISGAAGALMAVGGLCAGLWRRATLMETARWVDSRQQLQERLSTALEVSQTNGDATWSQLLVRDAAAASQTLDPRKLSPYHLPRATRWALLVLALSAGLGFVPEYRTKQFVQKQKDRDVIKEAGRELAQLTRRTLTERPPILEPTRKALETVNELGEHMAKVQLTRSEALKDLANVTEKLKDQTKELGKNPAFKALSKAARTSSKGGTPSSAELQKQIESLQKSLGQQSADSSALDKLKNDLEKAKQAASGIPEKDAPEAEKAREQLSQSLADLAKQAKELGASLPSLEDAIAALSKSQIDQVVKDLNFAEIDLEKMQAMAKALKDMQLQASELGKDLGEQLERGQAEAAQANLQKMSAALQSPNIDAEKLKKMMAEISKALKPAGEYGKVADLLKEGAAQMGAGQHKAASESLAKAAQELDKMMAEMGDAQSMIASLEALQQAQMCIGNGMTWSNGKSGRGGAGKGGKPGKGVGTWADEDSFVYPEITERWDNSGVTRPDMEGRGKTDRGDGQLSDNLLPTKVKGQMTPGGPMPSVTLKGVSIKGTSKVDFKEMTGAAQSDAQSALSQEQVPKAYRGAVRDYFNDLKE